MIGRKVSVDELMSEIRRDIPFYDQSAGGVTFTGGEPLMQMQFLRDVLLECKKLSLHTTLDTSGQTSWANIESLLHLVDLFLYDIKHMDADTHTRYTSASNRKILYNLSKLAAENVSIIVRIPLIPGVNDDEQNLEQTAAYLRTLPQLQGVELMPYHDIGVTKYQALGMKYKMGDTATPTNDQIASIEDLFSRCKLPVIRHLSGREL